MNSVLIVDDELQMRRLLEITLQAEGLTVSSASTALEGLKMAEKLKPSLVLLDLGLPDEHGHQVLKKLRQWYTNPVIILSVQQEEQDIVTALDNGANDYLSKPFRTGELLARIRSCLRGRGPDEVTYRLQNNELLLNLSHRTLSRNGAALKLTATEFELLTLFARNEGRVLTHQQLLRQVWGPGYIRQTQYLRVFVAQLRKKIEHDPEHPELILTESGVGYRFSGKGRE